MEPEFFTIKLLFVRHGQTQHNKTGTLAGQQPGNLTALGQSQAKKIGNHLKNHEFDHIYVSDLQRTKQTLQNAVEKAPKLKQIPVTYTNLLREKLGGVLEGKPLTSWPENAKKEGKNIRQYKCEGAQSWKDVMERARKFMRELVEGNQKTNKKELKVLAISHGGYMMQFHNVCRVLNGEPEIFDNSAKNCSMHEFEIKYPKQSPEYNEKMVKLTCTMKNFVGHLS